MRKSKCVVIAISVCVCSILFTACGSDSDINKKKNNKDITTIVDGSVEIETTIVSESTTEQKTITKEDVTTATETTTIPETTTKPETTTSAEATTKQETTKAPETITAEETTTALTVTALDKSMYVKSSVNVRSGPSTDFDKIGSLGKGKAVKVTGQSEQTGWYRIDYNGKVGYVSNSYLQAEPLPEPETTTKTPVKETSKPAASGIQNVLNNATLNPFRSDFAPAYEEIDKVFASIFKDGMTTYDKVKACYDYLINNCSYGHNEYVMDYIDAYFYGYTYEVRTYGILKGKIGVCDDYSAAFATMMQALGLNCYVVGGQTSKSGGGYTGHAWCEMNIDGTIYVFDPQVEDNIAKGGKIKDYRFGKKYEQVPGKYIKAE